LATDTKVIIRRSRVLLGDNIAVSLRELPKHIFCIETGQKYVLVGTRAKKIMLQKA